MQIFIPPVHGLPDGTQLGSSSADLDVSDTAYPKVTIRIGDAGKALDAALKGVRSRQDSNEGVVAQDFSRDGDSTEASDEG